MFLYHIDGPQNVFHTGFDLKKHNSKLPDIIIIILSDVKLKFESNHFGCSEFVP